MLKSTTCFLFCAIILPCYSLNSNEEPSKPITKPKLIFHAPFDGDAKAKHAGGSMVPIHATGLKYAKGIFGDAVEIGHDAMLVYSTRNNIRQDQGTISFWLKPNWTNISFGENSGQNIPNRCLFSQPLDNERIGSGALWFWFWGQHARADISDSKDSYQTGQTFVMQDTWYLFTLTWNGHGGNIYCNGKRITPAYFARGDGDSYFNNQSITPFNFAKDRFDKFFIGSENGRNPIDGWIDDLKIYDRLMTDEEVRDDAIKQLPNIRFSTTKSYYFSGNCTIEGWIKKGANTGNHSTQHRLLLYPYNEMQRQKTARQFIVRTDKNGRFSVNVGDLSSGIHVLSIKTNEHATDYGALSLPIFVLNNDDVGISNHPHEHANDKPVISINATELSKGNNFSSTGLLHSKKIDGKSYLELGGDLNDRIAFQVTLPKSNAWYFVEWTYPDNAKRTIEVVIQRSKSPQGDYGLQSGVFCGDEFPNTGKMQSFMSPYWASTKDITIIVNTARKGAPAAIGEFCISLVGEQLPVDSSLVKGNKKFDRRKLGLYFEDPALAACFGYPKSSQPDGYIKTVRRLTQYLNWAGMNYIAYPGVFYQGLVAGSTNRENPHGAWDIMLRHFEMQGITLMLTINLHNLPYHPKYSIDKSAQETGSLHNTPIMIHNKGKPNPGGFHGTPPLFNPLHPDTQQCVDGYIERLLDECADSPAFGGIILHLTEHTIPWFGAHSSGYNDYNIEQFQKDTGVTVPVDRNRPDRGQLYYEWLTTHSKEKWTEWRCAKISEWYTRLAEKITSRRKDLKLGIFTYLPTSDFDDRIGTTGAVNTINREAGLDTKFFQNKSNVIIGLAEYPADYRHAQGFYFHGEGKHSWLSWKTATYRRDSYELIENVNFPWVNIHDRYFENAIGGLREGQSHWSCGAAKPLNLPWADSEMDWRVSAINPSSLYSMDQFVFPLKFNDILGFSKGGFLIGTKGIETNLRDFAKAYTVLPEKKFVQVDSGHEDLTIRKLTISGDNWFYLLNTGRKQCNVKLRFNQGTVELYEPGFERKLKVDEGIADIELKPSQLRSFVYSGKSFFSIYDVR